MSEHSVTSWIDQLKAGSNLAIQELWQRYSDRLIAQARNRLRGRLRLNDEEDIALSAFHSFCQAAQEERYARLNDRQDLWQLLLMHTTRKVVSRLRDEMRLKRGGGATAAADTQIEDLLSMEPDPAAAAVMVEEYDRLLNLLPDEELRRIAVARLEGRSNEEIAGRLNRSVRSIERKLSVIRGIWAEAVGGD